MPAVPPFLEFSAQADRKQSQDCGRGPGARLQQLNGVGRTAAGGQIGNETPTNPSPARFLAAPHQTTTGPGQLLPIKQTATGTNHPEAVLPPRAGVDTAVVEHGRHLRSRGSCRARCRHRNTRPSWGKAGMLPAKSHPEGWRRLYSRNSSTAETVADR